MPNGDPLILAQQNTETGRTVLQRTPLVNPIINLEESAFVVKNSNGGGIEGYTDTRIGVRGQTVTGRGVVGTAQKVDPFSKVIATGTGVLGSSQDGPGVIGQSGVVGVVGKSGAGTGVQAFARGTGVHATTTGLRTDAIVGISDTGIGVRTFGGLLGVWGRTEDGRGVYGLAQADGGVGVYGEAGSLASAVNGIGVYGLGGLDPEIGGLAARFDGPVLVNGPFVVLGPKSAAVPHKGSHRLLYSLESPESWFEDFGEGKIKGGKSKVKLDRDFAALVKTDKYHIFLTPKGDSNGLYISGQSPIAFEVREQNGGKSNLTFSYRVVAKRKDISGRRLEKIKLPKAPKVLTFPSDPEIFELPESTELDGVLTLEPTGGTKRVTANKSNRRKHPSKI